MRGKNNKYLSHTIVKNQKHHNVSTSSQNMIKNVHIRHTMNHTII